MKRIFQLLTLVTVFFAVTAFFGVIAYVIYRETDPQVQFERELINSNGIVQKIMFAPDDPLKETLIGLIKAEKKRISCAIYAFSEKDIAQALIAAFKRGVIVELVTDRSFASDDFSKIPMLANHGLPVYVFQVMRNERFAGIMHMKTCLFESNIQDKCILWLGSYNFSRRAGESNQENVVILEIPEFTQRIREQFEVLKQRSLLISGKDCCGDLQTDLKEEKKGMWDSFKEMLGR